MKFTHIQRPLNPGSGQFGLCFECGEILNVARFWMLLPQQQQCPQAKINIFICKRSCFGPVFASCFAAPVGVALHFRNRLGKGTLSNQLKRRIPLCVLQKAPVLSVNLIDLWGLHSKHPASLSELAFLCHVARRALNCSISMSSTLTLLALWLHQPQLAGPPPQIFGKSTLNCQQLTSKNYDERD